MSNVEFEGVERKYKPTIADSAIYQNTVAQSEKYKSQRDQLLNELKDIIGAFPYYSAMRRRINDAIAKVEQSL